MKTGLIFLLMICCLDYSFGQQKKKIYVREVKENRIIDSLIDFVVKDALLKGRSIQSNIITIIAIGNQSCDTYNFSVNINQREESIVCTANNVAAKDPYEYSCFQYKNYNIFVRYDNKNLFSRKQRLKAFKFLYKACNDVSIDVGVDNVLEIGNRTYRYSKGSFSIEEDNIAPAY